MRPSELTKMFELEDTYWWFVARRALVLALLARHRPSRGEAATLLDVGCGTGAMLAGLSAHGRAVGIDASEHALAYCRRRGHHDLVQARGESLPIADASADAVTALDLLEHIPEDGAAVKEFARVLRPGGVLIVTVPAGAWLWSEHDEALDHHRRYRSRRLRELLLEAGLVIERLSPLITLLLLPVAALRLLQRLRRRPEGPRTALIVPSKLVNALLIRLLWLENQWLLRFNLPAGVSLMAVARKPAEPTDTEDS